jgi:hypothetical protein
MNAKIILVAAALCLVGLVPAVAAQGVACTVSDATYAHQFNAFSNAGVATTEGPTSAGVAAFVFSTNNSPCDQAGSDGDNEHGVGGAQMPIAGATCPYSQDVANVQAGGGHVTVGHHGDGIYAENAAGIDLTWTSGVDGQDPAAALAGQTCAGNGIISADPTTDPADCSDSSGANANLLGNVHQSTHPLSIGTNDPASGHTCFDSVDGNEWTFLNFGPFVGTGGCIAGLAPQPNGVVGFSHPVSGTIMSGIDVGSGSGSGGSPCSFNLPAGAAIGCISVNCLVTDVIVIVDDVLNIVDPIVNCAAAWDPANQGLNALLACV